MICYKDMTFCPYWKDCNKGNKCHRALTDKVIQDANKWWKGDGAPVCQYAEKPECFETKERK